MLYNIASLSLLLAAFVSIALAGPVEHYPAFTEYVKQYGKNYAPGSREWRHHEQMYTSRVRSMVAHNKLWEEKKASYWMAINAFTDAGVQDLPLGYAGAHAAFASNPVAVVTGDALKTAKLASSLNWTAEGIVTPVKDQGTCGSCWAFTATEMVESYLARDTGILADLGVQQLVDCVENPNQCGGSGGCSGATANLAFDYLMEEGGFITEWAYPYLSYWNSVTKDVYDCKYDSYSALSSSVIAATVEGYVKVENNSYSAMMAAIAQGPVSISVDASTWGSYGGGVFDGCKYTNVDLNHAVMLVGYGTDDETEEDYWLVRNSWSASWGENGYIRLKRYSADEPCGYDYTPQDGSECAGGATKLYVCGTCGMFWDASYLTGVSKYN